MKYDDQKAKQILEFILKGKWEHGVRESALLASSYNWLVEFLKCAEAKEKLKEKNEGSVKADPVPNTKEK